MKQAELELSDPKKMAPDNWAAFCVITGHLVTALRVREDYRTDNHGAILR